MCDNADLVMFYSLGPLKDTIHYIASLDAIVIAQFNDDILHLWDVFAKGEVELDKIIEALANPQITRILLGFTPKDTNSYEVKEVSGDDYLFVQRNKTDLFAKNKLMFPLLSHA